MVKAVSTRAGCSGPCPVRFEISPSMETMENSMFSAQTPAGFSHLVQYPVTGRDTISDREHAWEKSEFGGAILIKEEAF